MAFCPLASSKKFGRNLWQICVQVAEELFRAANNRYAAKSG